MSEREAEYRKMVEQFPDSPLGHFSLGRFLLEAGRYAEAAQVLGRANALQAEWAAALVALGDAQAGAGERAQAAQTWQKAREVALAQRHPSLAEEIDERLAELSG
jgi:uncharacterized protein HemY